MNHCGPDIVCPGRLIAFSFSLRPDPGQGRHPFTESSRRDRCRRCGRKIRNLRGRFVRDRRPNRNLRGRFRIVMAASGGHERSPDKQKAFHGISPQLSSPQSAVTRERLSTPRAVYGAIGSQLDDWLAFTAAAIGSSASMTWASNVRLSVDANSSSSGAY